MISGLSVIVMSSNNAGIEHMSKSKVVLVLVIAGLLWASKDYLGSKKEVVLTGLDSIGTTQEPQELKQFNN